MVFLGKPHAAHRLHGTLGCPGGGLSRKQFSGVCLAAVGQAMNIPQRKTMSAADAPKKWRDGNHQLVMDYVLGDSRMTNQIIAAIIERQGILWVTKKGIVNNEPMPCLKTVEEILRDPDPDQSWMSTPIPRSKFHNWLSVGL